MKVLLAEDRSSLRLALAETLRRAGYEVVEASEGKSAAELVDRGGFDLGLYDLKMPVLSGLDLLKATRARWPLVPVVLLTAYGSVELAVEAMKAGAADFLTKPVEAEHLLLVVQRALEASRRERVHEALAEDLGRSPAFQEILGESPALLEAQAQAQRIAPTEVTVLLLGETGTGKELFARAIHRASPRARQPFVAVNCAAIPSTLLENELFGHEKGAYTGAHETRPGRFEVAHRGTVFLDEIGEMAPDLQAKLLRVLEEKAFTRVGGTSMVRVDVRVLCATNRDLSRMVAEKEFRQDLYYRLAAFPIRIPPLRERPEDIPRLAAHFLRHFGGELGRPRLELTPQAYSHLAAQPWPGNVRELMNRIERACILAGPDGLIDTPALEPPSEAAAAFPAPSALEGIAQPEAWLEAEGRWRAGEVLRRCGGDMRRAARLLGLPMGALEEMTGRKRR